ncbi:MAG TPA: HlyD family efflux transporter periplasmic adaptor subunit [Patescibacteria group bacterium]|nr:HlyD family efflux transporter periplasmic adaptor subunit [Patescibacteria group bacterium]
MSKRLKHAIKAVKKRVNRYWKWFIRASWKKRIAVIIALLIILYILKSIFFGGNKQQYTFDTVQKGTITQLVTENGNVISTNETDVYSPTTGVLDQIYVKNGDYVHAGDKLFTIRSTATPQEQAVASANYQAALSTLTTAQNNKLSADAVMWTKQLAYLSSQNTQNFKNNNTTNPATNKNYTDLEKFQIDNTVIQTQKDFSAAEQAYKTADAAITDAQAQVASTSLAYQATQNATITAPTSGTVSNIIGLRGAKVVAQVSSASTTTTTTQATITPVLVLGSNRGYAIHTSVSEVDINKVNIGQNVTVLFSAIQNHMYTGKVTQEDTYGTDTAGVITYNVFVSLDNGDTNIKPDMSANLTIDTAERKDILTVANAAIVPYQNGKAVQVLGKNGKVMYRPITVGIRGFTRSEVLRGITEGTKVILGNTTLQNNQGSIGG